MKGSLGRRNRAMQHVLVEPSCSTSRSSSSWAGCSGRMPSLEHQHHQHGAMFEENPSLAANSWTLSLAAESGAVFRTRPAVPLYSCEQIACSSSSPHASSPCRTTAARLPGLGSYCSGAAWSWRTIVEPLMSSANCSPTGVEQALERHPCQPIHVVFACGVWAAVAVGSVWNDWPWRPSIMRERL